MITLIDVTEDQCALCTREGTKEGALTKSDSLGEAFLCWNHVKKMAAIEADRAKTEPEKPESPAFPAMVEGNGR
jgi:hypothetical protein